VRLGEIYAGSPHLATYNMGYDEAGSQTIPLNTYFIHADWLGTERVRSTAAGALYESCASNPFGDLLSCTGGDVSPMHFSGKERDAESGLDYFGARYYASGMGRWMSPDWSARLLLWAEL
jgi:RHS repeat-associated protein